MFHLCTHDRKKTWFYINGVERDGKRRLLPGESIFSKSGVVVGTVELRNNGWYFNFTEEFKKEIHFNCKNGTSDLDGCMWVSRHQNSRGESIFRESNGCYLDAVNILCSLGRYDWSLFSDRELSGEGMPLDLPSTTPRL